MKKKRFVQIFLILLCIVMLSSTPAYATEARASEQITLSSVNLTRKSDGDLNLYYMVQGTGTMDVIGANKVEIQRNTITGWVTEYTFNSDEYPEMLTTNGSRYSATVTYTPLFPSKNYRAVVMVYAENYLGSTTVKMISKTV